MKQPEAGPQDAPGAWTAACAPPEGPRAGGVALTLATLFGLGYWPVAPGTLGSLATLALAWLLESRGLSLAVPVLAALLIPIGVWAAGRVCAQLGDADPSLVVVDEAAGMFLSLSFLPGGWEMGVAAFLLFRILDIVKPWPANALEALPGGLGVMADDLICGLYTNVLLQIAAAWILP